MVFGSPTHRLESQLESTARVLELDAHFFYLPSHLILCFNNPRKQTSETAFLRAVGSLDSAKLARVHAVNRDVLHDVISASEGSRLLKEITTSPPIHGLWTRVAIVGMCSFFAAPVAFDGSFIDMFASFILGSLMGLCQLTLAATNPLFLNCFEITMAVLVSFLSKGLSATGYFCYQACASAGIVMILPGFVILQGSLEIASRSVVAGSIRVVYGCVLSLFLGVGISIGSEIFVGMYPPSKNDTSAVSTTGTDSASSGTIACNRATGLPWWNAAIPPIYLLILVPGFAVALSMWTKEVVRSKQFCASIYVACSAYVVLYFSKQVIPDQAVVSSAIAAFAIGLLGTLWSRIARGTAFTTQSTAVLLLVPNGLAAAGGLALTSSSTSFEQGTTIALRQISVAIGIVMGLFAASLLTYSFSRRKRSTYFSY
ncbi:hypothetical protein BDY24DRAFT_355194 [Mrakia frigida]|uniref:uncharacterized protein n=1 Tax=Mrakia frigida TaxID=29902 RepID=UPI003FCC057A